VVVELAISGVEEKLTIEGDLALWGTRSRR
jgi:hypothetical protein